MALFIYMNIKRIIQEEIDSFDWTNEVNTTVQVGTCLQEPNGVQWTVHNVSGDIVGVSGSNGRNDNIIMDYISTSLNNGSLTYCQV